MDGAYRALYFPVNFCYELISDYRFSGDTRPTPNIPRVANGVTLLIHEASFGDDQKEQMSLDRLGSKAHSTISEAIQVGRE